MPKKEEQSSQQWYCRILQWCWWSHTMETKNCSCYITHWYCKIASSHSHVAEDFSSLGRDAVLGA